MKTVRNKLWYGFVHSEQELRSFFSGCIPEDDHYLIKPNWVDSSKGGYTEARILDILFSVLKGKKTVIEGHSHSRNDLSMKITPQNFMEKKEWIRAQEKEYLQKLGLCDILNKHGCEYINITEEWWAGRTADADEVQRIVEEKHQPITQPEIYGYVPRKLLALRGKTLINLSRIKLCSSTCRDYSLSLKNMFGLLPHASRLNFHATLVHSILDVNVVYKSLFNVVGICEGIDTAVVFCEKGPYQTSFGSNYDVIQDLGVIVCGNPLDADVFTAKMFHQDLLNRELVVSAQRTLGKVDMGLIEEAPLAADLSKY
jgi:hypothetical protein